MDNVFHHINFFNWLIQRWEKRKEHQAIIFLETFWKRSDAQLNHLFHFALSFSTDVPNRRYHYSKTFNISVVCIGLFISLCGSYKELVWLVIACSSSSVLKLAAHKYLGLRIKPLGTPRYHLFFDTLWMRSGALVKHLFHFVLSFWTASPNHRYGDSKNLNISVGYIRLSISPCRAY